MTNKHLHKAIVVWANACRFSLAVVFLFSGFIKANDPWGTVYKIQDYLEALGMFGLSAGMFPNFAALLLGGLEFCIGVYLFFGIRRWATSIMVLLFMAVMTPVSLWLAVANPISDCGCFGDAVILTNWETFFKNIVLLAVAVCLFKWRRFIFKFVTDKVDWLISLYSIVFVLFLTIFCHRYLPVFDFLPYHVGADIRKGMEIPEDKNPPVYETVFTYEKDGERRDFTVDNLPGDSLWTFVDSRTVMVKAGYEPPIQDFALISYEDGLDLTDEILADSQYVFMLVSPWLDRADDSSMDLINEIYDYSVEYGYRFFCVTASTDDAILGWRENTGAEYPFLLADEITLKTMIRYNPGLILLKNGVVLQKWSANDLPDEYQLNAPLDRLPIGKADEKTVSRKLMDVIGSFFAPLLLLTVIDFVWIGIRNRRNSRRMRKNLLETTRGFDEKNNEQTNNEQEHLTI